MRDLLNQALRAFSDTHSGWIAWNLFLAFIPLALSFWLFRRPSKVRDVLWWTGLVMYVAFLPNAPYLLTDIIHLIRATQSGYSVWVIGLVFFPLHLIAILGGFEAYVVSLINQGYYLKRIGAKAWILWAELGMHLLCGIGVFIGRFRRFNSWDLVTDPGNVLLTTLDDLTNKRPAFVICVTFAILAVLYWIFKQITLGLKLRLDYARQGRDVLE